MAGPIATYAFINAKLRARISKLLPETAIEALVRAASLQQTLSLLHDTEFSFLEDVYNRTGDLKLAELELLKKEISLYGEVGRYLRGAAAQFTTALALRFEVENLKNALRLFFDRTVRKRSVEDNIHYIILDQICNPVFPERIVNAESVEQVIDILGPTPYGQALDGPLRELETVKSLFRVEITLDRLFYRQLLAKAQELDIRDRTIARRLVGVEIDLQNINWIVRLKNFHNMPASQIAGLVIAKGESVDEQWIRQTYEAADLAPLIKNALKAGGAGLAALIASQPADATARLAMLESILEQILLREVHKILGSYPFTIGIVVCYFVLKEREMRRIRTILNAKLYELSPERIEEFI
jgi:V/A-type H+-transporting ATPase subunit C